MANQANDDQAPEKSPQSERGLRHGTLQLLAYDPTFLQNYLS